MPKPVVKYLFDVNNIIKVGKRAIIVPVDHPGQYVSNQGPAITTNVISYDPDTGDFETQNTLYKEA